MSNSLIVNGLGKQIKNSLQMLKYEFNKININNNSIQLK